jgi:hypothetical protein
VVTLGVSVAMVIAGVAIGWFGMSSEDRDNLGNGRALTPAGQAVFYPGVTLAGIGVAGGITAALLLLLDAPPHAR